MFRKYLFYFLLLCFTQFACQNQKKYKFATTSVGTYRQVGEELANFLEKGKVGKFQMLSEKGMGAKGNCILVAEKKADFGITQNDVIISELKPDISLEKSGLRTVAPLYPEVLFIIYPDSLNPTSLKDLVTGRRLGLGPKNSGVTQVLYALFKHYNIDSTDFTVVNTPFNENIVSEKIDVSISLTTGYNNIRIRKMLQNNDLRLFSLGDPNLIERGSEVEGFCFHYTVARPFVIPKGIYADHPLKPILTVAIDAVILTHKETDNTVVYEMAKAIFEQKLHNPILTTIGKNYNMSSLNYPLHPGTRMYLDRNKPSFWIENGELILSLIIAFVGIVTAAWRWQKRRRKNKVDVFYKEVLEIDKNLENILDSEYKVSEARQKLKSIKHHAFQMLIDENIEANESFRIFQALLEDLIRKLEK